MPGLPLFGVKSSKSEDENLVMRLRMRGPSHIHSPKNLHDFVLKHGAVTSDLRLEICTFVTRYRTLNITPLECNLNPFDTFAQTRNNNSGLILMLYKLSTN